jgi:hypothetical protein
VLPPVSLTLCTGVEAILTQAFRYLENPKYRETFESSHSVLLSIFALEKSIANQLAPWYTALLIKVRPSISTAPNPILTSHLRPVLA